MGQYKSYDGADRFTAERLQTREREELTDEEKGKLFMELMEKRRKHFAKLRAQEKRNRPPTKAHKRTQMSTYLKHMGGYKHKQLMGKSYDEIQKLFDKEMKRVNTFVAMSSEAQESNEKKEEDKETDEVEEVKENDEAELKKHLVIKKDDDIAIDAIPLATKLPMIIDYKLFKEGIMGIDREDLLTLWKFSQSKVTSWEKEVAELKKDPLHTQVTALVDDHLDARLGAIRDEFMNRLSASITARVTKQVKIQLPQILTKVGSNFAPPEIQHMVTEALEHVVLAKEYSQPQYLYEDATTLIEFELKKILINTIDKSESYLAAPEHRECYEGLIKSYDLNKTIFSTYDRGLKKRKTSKDAELAKGPKAKESQSGSSKGDKSQSKSSRKSVQLEEPEFEVTDLDMPQDQEENPGNDDEEPKEKTPQQRQNQSWLMTLASSAKKWSKTFDELMSTLIDFSAFIMNGLKINNLTQETLLGLAFILLKGTCSNYAELEYDFEECYKSLSEKLDWENPEGGDYPFDLTKPLPLVMSRNRQKVHVDYFFNNDLKYLQGGTSTMTYMTSLTKTKATQYDLQGIEDMVEVIRKHGYGYLKEIVVRRADNDLYRFKEGDFSHLRINDIKDMLLLVVQNRLTNLSGDDVSDFVIALTMFTRSLVIQKKKDPYTPYQDPQGFIYVDNNGRNRLMRSDKLYKFSDRTLTELRTSLDDITKNIQMEYLPKRRWSTLEKKRANIMIKAIEKQLKERRLTRSLEKFVGGRHYGTDLRLLQRTI
ncbi:hypothetical protein Tco_0185605 [Tanacetum coccineum]